MTLIIPCPYAFISLHVYDIISNNLHVSNIFFQRFYKSTLKTNTPPACVHASIYLSEHGYVHISINVH